MNFFAGSHGLLQVGRHSTYPRSRRHLPQLSNLKYGIAAALSLLFQQSYGAGLNCEPLKPSPPSDVSAEATGKIDAAFRKFISVQGNIEGTYREASRDVLKDYPRADRLFLWSRMLYLYCETIRTSTTITDDKKLDKLDEILKKLDAPPPSSGLENLLDPPVLQFGMTKGQVLTLLRARTPERLAGHEVIAGLQALLVGRDIGNTPATSGKVLRARVSLFGLQGEGAYGFDDAARLTWLSVWNSCVRDRHEFSHNEPTPHPSWLNWSDHEDIGIQDAVKCEIIAKLPDNLRQAFGAPVNEADGDTRAGFPTDSEVCYDLFHYGGVTCDDFRHAREIKKFRFLAKDRITPVDLEIRTLRYSAKQLKPDNYWIRKIRERKVAIVSISDSSGAKVIDPVVSGVFFRYLN